MQNHYHTLGVDEQATPNDIRRAYRQLVLLTHPDRTADPAAHQRFLRINEAYDVLSNPARRRGYDALLQALRTPPPPRHTPPPRPAAAAPRQPGFRPRAYAKPPVDLRAYQRPIRWWGGLLALLAVLIILDYSLLQHTVQASFLGAESARDGRGALYTDFYTSRGAFRTYSDLPTNPAHLQVRLSAIFRLVSQVSLPDGSPVPTRLAHRSLFVFTGLLLALALLLQRTALPDATRVSVALVATVVGSILVLMILT
ncbi:J domain-containing protein [Hymenobacter cellulosilyticus]|uniref:J domain-containing protein n=1 Tax=Hymenobacter cellulosilyticus TaxID=2932248 RepID=A0A8T9QA30_9BACT|nr:J domain-containing protein [Hymenobacter cellulosilyticus]UOQ72670.1 J domain-containing protein [Hymenobacter cellulosilyticus]